MLLRQNERTALFIDGASLHHAARNLGLKSTSAVCATCLKASAFSSVPSITPQCPKRTTIPLRPLTDWLAYNGYHLVLKMPGSLRIIQEDGVSRETWMSN